MRILFLIFFLLLSDCSFAQAGSYGRNAAVKYYRKSADRGEYSGYMNLAVLLKDSGRYYWAIRVLKAANVKFPRDNQILKFLGRLYFLDADMPEAISVLEFAHARAPEDPETLITLGLCYVAVGRDEDAESVLRAALVLDPKNVMVHLSLADIYFRGNKLEESAREYKTVNLLDASIQHFYGCWGNILFELGNFVEAYKIFEKLRAIDPSDQFVAGKLDDIRSKLGQDFFAKEKDKRAAEKALKRVIVKPGRSSEGIKTVTVGLVSGADQVELKMSTDFTLRTKQSGALLGRGKGGGVCSVKAVSGGKLHLFLSPSDTVVSEEPVVISSTDPGGACTIFGVHVGKGDFWQKYQDRSYRGQIEVSCAKGEIQVINKISLEDYLYSVVPSEMIPSWPFEALKAQAVAARSEAVSKLGRHKKEGFDFCAEVHCQSYGGVEQETATTNLAVDDTFGQVLYHEGSVVDAIYSSCCGGHTQGNIFSQKRIGYFTGIYDGSHDRNGLFPLSPFDFENWLKYPPSDIYCNVPEFVRASNFRWVRVYSAKEMNDLASKLGDVGCVRKIMPIKRGPSGHLTEILVVGSKKNVAVEKELNIRKALGNLRSGMFKTEIKYDKKGDPEKFVFYGGGWGHGVGMCQSGACGMALKGKNYEQILKHYYAGTEIKKLY